MKGFLNLYEISILGKSNVTCYIEVHLNDTMINRAQPLSYTSMYLAVCSLHFFNVLVTNYEV